MSLRSAAACSLASFCTSSGGKSRNSSRNTPSVQPKIFRHGGKELVRDAVGFFVKAVSPQAFIREKLIGRPGVRKIPLPAGFIGAHHQAAGLLESGKMPHKNLRLFRRGEAGPEG